MNTSYLAKKINEKRNTHIEINKQPGLPINDKWDEIANSIKYNQVTIVVGETGSGKTTQLPKICLQAGRGQRGKIVCTQPRRLAAISIARRVSQELNETQLNLVSYKIRFNDKTTPNTIIQFVTDGILIAELKRNRYLFGYDTIIVDEAHERSLNIDFLLSYLRLLLNRRRDLRVIISSATIDVEFFRNVFKNASVINVSGRTYPVDIVYETFDEYDSKELSLAEKVKIKVELILKNDKIGNILVFLPTERDIIECYKELRVIENIEVLPLFSRLAYSQQRRIFERSNKQRVILATNIAETSITVPGIKYVIDSGLARISSYNWRIGVKSLLVSPISKASANQRAGRAGRTQPGVCYRLYSIDDFERREDYTKPEILRSNLSEVVLKLIDLDLCPVEEFPFITQPSQNALKDAIHTLKEIGAIDQNEKLTQIGKILNELPLDPRIGRMIIQAKKENALREIIIIASALSIQDPREVSSLESNKCTINKDIVDDRSDFITLVNIYNTFDSLIKAKTTKKTLEKFCNEHSLSYNRMMEWRDIVHQIMTIVHEKKWEINKNQANYESIHKSILTGFLNNIAIHKEKNVYLGAKGKELIIHPSSVLAKKRPKWIICAEITRTEQLYGRICAEIEPTWIEEIGSHLIRFHYYNPHYDKKRGEVVCHEKVTIFGLTLSEGRKRSFSRIDPELSKKIFISECLVPLELDENIKFVNHNKEIMNELIELENKLRKNAFTINSDELFNFYSNALSILEEKSSIKPINNLNDLLLAIKKCGDQDLKLDENKIKSLITEDINYLYPGYINIDNKEFKLIYRYTHHSNQDGITIQIPFDFLNEIDKKIFDWLVPGYLIDKIQFILKHLPKDQKNKLKSLEETSIDITRKIFDYKKNFKHELLKTLLNDYKIELSIHELNRILDQIPPHLIMKIELINSENKIIDRSINFQQLKDKWNAYIENSINKSILLKNLLIPKSITSIKDYPENIPQTIEYLDKTHNIQFKFFPFFKKVKENEYILDLTTDHNLINKHNLELIKTFIKQICKKDLDVAFNNLFLNKLPKYLPIYITNPDNFKDYIIYSIIVSNRTNYTSIHSKQRLLETIDKIKEEIIKRLYNYKDKINAIITELSNIGETIKKLENYLEKYGALQRDDNVYKLLLNDLKLTLKENHIFNNFFNEIDELSRYLKAIKVRAERALADPQKDKNKWFQLKPYLDFYYELIDHISKSNLHLIDEFKLYETMLFEYKISLFAPEIGTKLSVSQKKLDEFVKNLKLSLI